MTISSGSLSTSHNGGGTTGPFAFNFLVYESEHLEVVKRDVSGVETTLEPDVDFTVTGLGLEEGGEITLDAVLAVGEKITITVNPSLVQEVDLNDDDDFPAESIERQLDLMVQMIRYDRRLSQRALVLNATDIDGSGAFNARGNRITNVGDAVEDSDVLTLGFANELITEMQGYVSSAAASAIAASGSASTASTQAGIATTKANAAAASLDAIELIISEAEDNFDELLATAEEWAESPIEVEPGKYSAKYWAEQAEAIVEGTAYELLANKGQNNGYAPLDNSGDVPLTHIPALAISQTTGLQTALDGKADAAHTHAYVDLTGKPTLGTAAALDVGTGASQIVQLTADAKLPAIDGSLLTNLAVGGTVIGDSGTSDITGVSSVEHSWTPGAYRHVRSFAIGVRPASMTSTFTFTARNSGGALLTKTIGSTNSFETTNNYDFLEELFLTDGVTGVALALSRADSDGGAYTPLMGNRQVMTTSSAGSGIQPVAGYRGSSVVDRVRWAWSGVNFTKGRVITIGWN